MALLQYKMMRLANLLTLTSLEGILSTPLPEPIL